MIGIDDGDVEAGLINELERTIGPVLAANRYLVLGTVDDSGAPWVTPVFFASVGEDLLYWVSSPTSRHSRYVLERPRIAITVFDPSVPIGHAAGVHLRATARLAGPAVTPRALEALNRRLPSASALTADDLDPVGTLALFEARIRERFVLLRGGDARSRAGVDESIRVPLRSARDALPRADASTTGVPHSVTTQ